MFGLKPAAPVDHAGRRAWLRRLAALGAACACPGVLAQGVPGRRIVSVGGALTEIVYALGAEGELVGVDTTSLYPALAQKLPNVGYARTLSAEGVLSLAPTLLVATEDAGPAAVLRQVGAAGVALHILPARHRFEGVLERVERMGELTGRQARAAQLAQSLRQEWEQVSRKVAARQGRAARVLFVLAHSPGQVMVSGQETSADAMLGYAGALNAVQGFKGYKPLTPEAVIAARPDLVLLTEQGLRASGGVEGILRLPGLAQTPAGKARRVLAQDAMFLLGFGPRLPAAVAALAAELDRALAT